MDGERTAIASWELPEALWRLLQPLFPVRNQWTGRPTEVDLRQVAAGIFYVLRTGIQWNAVPRQQFGAPSTVYYYFQQWRDDGVFERLWAKAVERYDELQGIEWLWQSVDGAMTKAPQGGETTGPNPTDRGKLGTKRSLRVDGNGIPLAVVTAGANEPDMTLLWDTLASSVVPGPTSGREQPPNLCADKGYDFDICWAQARFFGYLPHIRARREEAQERALHPGWRPRRWVVEVTHSWLNRFRKLLVRFEELDDSYRALLHFACAYIALKRAGSF